jgi:hypothetical protein
VKIIGGVVIVLSALTMIGELGIALQALGLLGPKPTMHEMSAFAYGSAPGFVLYGALGIATGIGLLRAWRWARVSMLVFGSLIIAFGTIVGVGFVVLFITDRDPDPSLIWEKAIMFLFFLIPTGLGALLLIYFTRSNVKGYFQKSWETS